MPGFFIVLDPMMNVQFPSSWHTTTGPFTPLAALYGQLDVKGHTYPLIIFKTI